MGPVMIKTIFKTLNIQTLLWVALILALAGSLRHVAHVFSSIDGSINWGWVQALAVDVGLLALALGIMQRRRTKTTTWPLWLGVLLFSFISIYANLSYGLEFSGAMPQWVISVKPYIMAATLPVLVLYLSEIVGSDFNQALRTAEREQKKAERRTNQSETAEPNQLEQARAEKGRKKADKKNQLMELLRTNPELDPDAIRTRTGLKKTSYYTYLTELENEGAIERNGNGIAVITRKD